MTTTASVNLGEIAAFWRNSRRLYTIYSALNRTFEIGLPLCRDLEYPVDRSEPEVIDRVKTWFDQMDTHVQVWQLRQLLQSTNLQTEENLRALVRRHMDSKHYSEVDRDKIDFLLVQYFAHCAPHGLYEQQISLGEVARVLEPVLSEIPSTYPDWSDGLDVKLENLNRCNSLEELQKLGALLEVRELKLALREKYFEKPCLIAFTRFNFLARRAFFRAMHLDLHAIRNAINDLESRGLTVVDCREAGMTESESLEHVRHVVHQWKTPFRAPYTGGASFLQLILLRHALQHAQSRLSRAEGTESDAEEAAEIALQAAQTAIVGAADPSLATSVLEELLPSRPADMRPRPKPAAEVPQQPAVKHPEPEKTAAEKASPQAASPAQVPATSVTPPPVAAEVPIAPSQPEEVRAPSEAIPAAPAVSNEAVPPSAAVGTPGPVVGTGAMPELVTAGESAKTPSVPEDDYLTHCVTDIAQQLKAIPSKKSPTVSAITLAGCKLLISTWEVEAFTLHDDALAVALRRAVAARTILHVSLERQKKGVPTDLAAALEIAELAVEEMRKEVAKAKEARNIDAAVNLAATAKRLLSLIEEAEKLRS